VKRTKAEQRIFESQKHVVSDTDLKSVTVSQADEEVDADFESDSDDLYIPSDHEDSTKYTTV
jgi:hypothetical protein